MKRLRLILTLVLCMAIPLNALAALPGCACPAWSGHQASAANADMHDSDMHDCCEEMDGKSTSAKPCKPGQSCGSIVLSFALPAQFHFSTFALRVSPLQPLAAQFSWQVGNIWHPPSLL